MLTSPLSPVPVAILTDHAVTRMSSRHITKQHIETVLQYGRVFYARGAKHHIVGRREIERFRHIADLTALDGVHVVCSYEGRVLTTYRNRQFHTKHLRDRARRRGRRRTC